MSKDPNSNPNPNPNLVDPELAALLEEAKISRRRGTVCWAIVFRETADPTATAFLDAVEATPNKFVPLRVSEIMRTKFNFEIGRNGVSKHLRGECACRKIK